MRRGTSRHYVLMTSIVFAAVLAAGCERKDINQIKAEPSRYANREVAIVGSVVQSYSVLGKGAYEVDDGTGRLWVISDAGVPRKGSRVVVKGTVRDAFNLGSVFKLPEPVSSGLVMLESSHRAK